MFTRGVSFCGARVCIQFEDNQLHDILDFLFLDIGDDQSLQPIENFIVHQDPDSKNWLLTRNEQSLFKGKSLPGLATILMGEVLFHLIRDNDKGLAIHAGLVSDDSRAMLIPGSSGSGKSSVTTWMLANGMHYHTDELIIIDLNSYDLESFTRPLNIKTSGLMAIESLFDLERYRDQLLVSSGVTMIPHRLVNPEFRTTIPKISHLIFPKYIAESKSELINLSGAEAGLEMMRSNVIARNLPAHGFGQITNLVRNIPAFRLHYRHFADLPALMTRFF